MGLTRNGIRLMLVAFGAGQQVDRSEDITGATRSVSYSSNIGDNYLFISKDTVNTSDNCLLTEGNILAKFRKSNASSVTVVNSTSTEIALTITNSGTEDIVAQSYGSYNISSSYKYLMYIQNFENPITIPAGATKKITLRFDVKNI